MILFTWRDRGSSKSSLKGFIFGSAGSLKNVNIPGFSIPFKALTQTQMKNMYSMPHDQCMRVNVIGA